MDQDKQSLVLTGSDENPPPQKEKKEKKKKKKYVKVPEGKQELHEEPNLPSPSSSDINANSTTEK